jgi:hypothetical protein
VLEQNTFAFAAFADDGGDITFINLQVDSIQNGPLIKPLGNIFKFYNGRIHRGTPYKADQFALRAIGLEITSVLIEKSKFCFFGYGAK